MHIRLAVTFPCFNKCYIKAVQFPAVMWPHPICTEFPTDPLLAR